MSLPSGYKRLEYIQSSGTQYIDTGFKPNQNTRVVTKFDMMQTDTAWRKLWGSGSGSYNLDFALWNYGTTKLQSYYGTKNNATVPITNMSLDVNANKNIWEYSGKTITFDKNNFTCAYSMYIFNINKDNTPEYLLGMMKLYLFKIYDNDVLVRDFIPCKNPSGVIGLWDDVNSVFYQNAGSGTFTAGPEIKGANKALIDGTGYDVNAGKCLVGGTTYTLKKGRTLIGGTAYNITFAPTYDSVFANNTWQQIIEACHNNAVPDTWNVADQKPMTINGVGYQIDIIGKNHDTYAAGGKAPLTFQLHDCYADTKQMNRSDTNSGGWTRCAMRQTHLPAILALMPTEVQNGIREVNKLTSAGSQSSTINTTADKLFLLSEVEIFGSTSYSAAGEGTQYDYYKAGNSKVKKQNGSATRWWERSPCASPYASFCMVYSNGSAYSGDASYALGVAFGFCF